MCEDGVLHNIHIIFIPFLLHFDEKKTHPFSCVFGEKGVPHPWATCPLGLYLLYNVHLAMATSKVFLEQSFVSVDL